MLHPAWPLGLGAAHFQHAALAGTQPDRPLKCQTVFQSELQALRCAALWCSWQGRSGGLWPASQHWACKQGCSALPCRPPAKRAASVEPLASQQVEKATHCRAMSVMSALGHHADSATGSDSGSASPERLDSPNPASLGPETAATGERQPGIEGEVAEQQVVVTRPLGPKPPLVRAAGCSPSSRGTCEVRAPQGQRGGVVRGHRSLRRPGRAWRLAYHSPPAPAAPAEGSVPVQPVKLVDGLPPIAPPAAVPEGSTALQQGAGWQRHGAPARLPGLERPAGVLYATCFASSLATCGLIFGGLHTTSQPGLAHAMTSDDAPALSCQRCLALRRAAVCIREHGTCYLPFLSFNLGTPASSGTTAHQA